MGIKTKFSPMGGKSAGSEVEFIRPNLSANGTLGGNSFAVSASSQYNTTYVPYKAVDGKTNTYWQPLTSDNRLYYIFYNPQALKVTKLIFTPSAAQYPTGISSFFVSNDNSVWTEISYSYSYSGSTLTTILSSSGYYKYYKATFSSSSLIKIKDIDITATYKV